MKFDFLKILYNIKDVNDNTSLFKFLSTSLFFTYFETNEELTLDKFDAYNEDLINVMKVLDGENFLIKDDKNVTMINKAEVVDRVTDNKKNRLFFHFASTIKMIVSKTTKIECHLPDIIKDVSLSTISLIRDNSTITNLTTDEKNYTYNQEELNSINSHCYHHYYDDSTANKNNLDVMYTLSNKTELSNLKKYFKNTTFKYNYEAGVNLDVIFKIFYFVIFFLFFLYLLG